MDHLPGRTARMSRAGLGADEVPLPPCGNPLDHELGRNQRTFVLIRNHSWLSKEIVSHPSLDPPTYKGLWGVKWAVGYKQGGGKCRTRPPPLSVGIQESRFPVGPAPPPVPLGRGRAQAHEGLVWAPDHTRRLLGEGGGGGSLRPSHRGPWAKEPTACVASAAIWFRRVVGKYTAPGPSAKGRAAI